MVRIGIIGLGPYWEQRYEPALRMMDQRIQIKAVYDPVRSRAEQVATQWDAEVVSGIGCLATRYPLDAFLLLHSDWMNHYPLTILSEQHRPVYIAGSLGEDLELLEMIHARATEQLVTLMPEFSRRYCQATSRLFELVVTQLGNPVSIQLETCCPAADQQVEVPGQKNETDFLVGLMDWCCYVMRTRPVRVETTLQSDSSDRSEDYRQIKIEFLPDPVTAVERVALLKIKTQQRETEPLFPRHQIQCRNGQAEFHSPDEIHWENAANAVTESLKSDRRELEVMLDHFCRRAVGGIIPVANIKDACQAIQLVRLSRASLDAGKPLDFTAAK
ncbi:hypothetical protein Pan161_11290 [Gimesia algae]|uniref:Gfo/Idh/MocA-like oxidoreductase N-terminal domain-containing protein n=2 Tax=Gimesia algae TaxID=2527971 RepID=A0A517V925_9PLAN|nr:hypothetical protein Pan161_11290 [Gimesia algae]